MSIVSILVILVVAQPSLNQETGWPEWPPWPPSEWPTWPAWPSPSGSQTTLTPSPPTPTPTPPTPTPTSTPTPSLPTPTPTPTPSAPTPTPTSTPPTSVPIPTPTPTPSFTPIPAPTPTPVFVAVSVPKEGYEVEELVNQSEEESVVESINQDQDKKSAMVKPDPDMVVANGEINVAIDVMSAGSQQDVMSLLENSPDLSLFAEIVKLGGFDEFLGIGSLQATLFAPTNAAINKAIEELGFKNFKEISKQEILVQDLVAYHIAPQAALQLKNLQNNQFLHTLFNDVSKIRTDVGEKQVSIQGLGSQAQVVRADITAGETVVHVVDTVLLPVDASLQKEINQILKKLKIQEFENLSQILNNVRSASTFNDAIAASTIPLDAKTILIPTNEAFSEAFKILGKKNLKQFLKDKNLLSEILSYHLISNSVGIPIAQLTQGAKLTTELEGKILSIDAQGFPTVKAEASEAKIINFVNAGDVSVYFIDTVLLAQKSVSAS